MATTIALTTIFTPPASCSSSWTFEAQYYNSVPGGLLLQVALSNSPNTECFPSGFSGHGRVTDTEVFSPGYCPAGYTTPVLYNNGATTTAICCPSNFAYVSTLSTVNFVNSSPVNFLGCTSQFSFGSVTTVLARSGDVDLNTEPVTGPIVMWAQPINIEYQSSDLRYFTTSTSSISLSTLASPGQSATNVVTSTSSPFPSASSASSSGSNLTKGAIAGIVIGAFFAASILITAVLFLLRSKGKSRPSSYENMTAEHELNPYEEVRNSTRKSVIKAEPGELATGEQTPNELYAGSPTFELSADSPSRH